MNIEELIADLRSRVNPQYCGQLGTESYERQQCVVAIESLLARNDVLREENKMLRDEVNGLTGSLDRAESVLQNLMSYLSVNGCRTEIDPENAELRIRDGINMLVRPAMERAEKAEAALKEAQDQPAVAWLIHEYQGTGDKRIQFNPHVPSIRDEVVCPIVTELYARPVPAPAVDVPEEWREVVNTMVEWWDDQHMTMAQGREICNKARAMLQSAEVKK